jgi:hypothetical protein
VTEPTPDRGPNELPVVAALRSLSVFGADQAGAYREHFSALAATLGDDVKTKLGTFLTDWAASGQPGIVALTGNAGTGKTAAAEAYCRALGAPLPDRDMLVEVSPARWVLKDLSGLPDPVSRATILSEALSLIDSQILVCANEGVMRDALTDLGLDVADRDPGGSAAPRCSPGQRPDHRECQPAATDR